LNLKLKRTPGIYVVGFMGCGKSTIGRMYADEIGWRFCDLDDDIEHQQNTTISELFAKVGEPEFRRLETAALQRRVDSVRKGSPTVLSLGGGAFAREENIAMLTDHGVTVWINTSFEIMRDRVASADHRPLAKDPERFAQLYKERLPFYERAEYRVDVPDGDSRAAVKMLLDLCLLD
jgi:shikimate kinase